MYIFSFTFQKLVFDFFNHNNQISRNTVPRCVISFTGNFQLHSIYNTSRNFYRNRFIFSDHSLSVSIIWLFIQNLTRSSTSWTSRSRLHSSQNSIGYTHYLPLTVTSGTRFVTYPWCLNFTFYFYFFLNSISNFFNSQFNFDT